MQTFDCPGCRRTFRENSVPDSGHVKCPFCNQLVGIPTEESTAPRKSIYCGPAYWMGNRFVVPRGGGIPAHACVICVREAGASLQTANFRDAPAWRTVGCMLPVAMVGIMFGIHAFSLPAKATVEVPVCPGCWTRWWVASALWAVLIILGFLPAVIGLEFFLMGRYGEGAMIWGLLVGIFGWAIFGYATRRFILGRFALICRGIDDRGVHLRPPRPESLRRAWGIEGEPPPPPPMKPPARNRQRRDY